MKVDERVLRVIDRATCRGDLLVLPEQLEREDYLAVDKVLKAAGGKWNRARAGHVFDGGAAEAIDPIILTGTVTDARREFGAFFTPPDLARRAAKLAGLRDGYRVLEPSAGHGALVLAARAEANVKVDAVELYPGSSVVLKSVDLGGGRLWGETDFLAMGPGDVGKFDAVLMNPPFAKMADAKHVLHAINFVSPGGRIVAIMSAAVTFRQAVDYRIIHAYPVVTHKPKYPLDVDADS
jgi:predicted RNA methylase